MIIKIAPREKRNIFSIISRSEFEITKMLLDVLDADIEYDNSIIYQYAPITMNDRIFVYAERYFDLDKVSKMENTILFRPLKSDKHANILIRMFEDLDLIDFDSLEIIENVLDNGRIKYSGYLKKGDKIIQGSYIKTAPSISILKVSIIANLLMNSEEYNKYYKYLLEYLHKR